PEASWGPCSNAATGLVGRAVGTAVVYAGRARRAAVRGTLCAAVGTSVVYAGRTGRAAVSGAFLLVRVLLGVSHVSS
ncbi:hypothetical protein ACFT56_27785, partial [Streptomyces cinereoruber]